VEFDLAAAQPTFSDDELAALFRALKLEGDPHNAADRARAMTQLTDALVDPARTREVVAALDAVDEDTSAAPESAGSAAEPASAAKPITKADWALMEDAPTTGRLLNALHQRTEGSRRADTRLSIIGGHIRAAGVDDGTSEKFDLFVTNPDQDHVELAQLRVFLVKAREALPEPRTSWWMRVADAYEALKGIRSATSWQAVRNAVDVELSHGARRWHVLVRYSDPTVFVHVANDHRTVIERDVARTEPEHFSRTLLDALDGDVRSTQMALDAVQQAMLAEPRALH
jgi:hypothetical protein